MIICTLLVFLIKCMSFNFKNAKKKKKERKKEKVVARAGFSATLAFFVMV